VAFATYHRGVSRIERGWARRAFVAAAAALTLAGAAVVGVAAPAAAAGWAVVASPNPSSSTGSHLNAVSCVSATNCIAVGYFSTASSPGRALVERWNGTNWVILTTPSPTGSTASYLNSVACRSATFCIAVGYFTTASSPGRTLVERWNGTKWVVVGSPNATGATGSYFNAVSCPTTSYCAAVGYSYNATATHTLAERFNGTNWAVVASPNPVGDDPDLQAVSCTSATSCFAVGYYDGNGGSGTTLIERWNGSKWAILASPNPKNSDAYLSGVSCVGATCTAVGVYYGTGAGRTLVERSTGSGWAIVGSPNPAGSGDSYLNDVRCSSGTSCVAVGAYASGADKTQVQRWNGSAWAVVASPNPAGSAGSYLNGLSCPGTICTAVGDWHGSGPSRTLAERG